MSFDYVFAEKFFGVVTSVVNLERTVTQIMADLNALIAKVDKLANSFSVFRGDLTKALTDLKAEVASSGNPQESIDAITTKIDNIQSMVDAADAEAKAADTPAPAPVPSPAP